MSKIDLRLKEEREKAGIGQKMMADMLEIGIDEYIEYEKGEKIPDMLTVIKIAQICKTTADEVLGFQRNFGVSYDD